LDFRERPASEQQDILVTGMDRSGTTVFGKLISYADGVQELFEPFNRDVENVCFPVIDKSPQLKDRVRPFPPPTRETIQYFDSLFWGRCSWLYNHARKVIKDPVAFPFASWLQERYNVKVIIKLRHPGAIYASRLALKYGPSLDHVKREFHRVLSLWERHANNTNWLFLTHEEFCEQPFVVLEKVYSFLSLPLSETVLKKARALLSDDNPNLEHGFGVLKLNPKAQIDNWKSELDNNTKLWLNEQTHFFWRHFYNNQSWN